MSRFFPVRGPEGSGPTLNLWYEKKKYSQLHFEKIGRFPDFFIKILTKDVE